MTTNTAKFSAATKLAARFDVGFERYLSDYRWSTTDTLRGAEADALVADLASAGIEASKAYDTDDRSQAWVYATLDEADLATAITWARTASSGDYLVSYADTGLTSEQDQGSRCGYSDPELDQIRRALAERDLRLVADDRGLRAEVRS